MRKVAYLVLAALAIFFSQVNSVGNAESKPETVKVVLAGGPPGGGLALQMEGIANAIRKIAPNYQVTNVPGNTVANLKRMGTGKIDVGAAWCQPAMAASRAEPPYERPVKTLSLFTLCPVFAQFRALAGTGLVSVRDMIEKKYPIKVIVGTVNGGPEVVARTILKAYGITYKDIESWGGKVYFQTAHQGTSLMGDGTAEAMFYVTAMPDPKIIELSRTRELRMFPISEPEILKTLESERIVKTVIPANTYNFVREDIPTVKTLSLILCRADLPDEVGYTVVKAVAENADYLMKVHKGFDLTSKAMPECRKFIPLNPGAERFYREKGWL